MPSYCQIISSALPLSLESIGNDWIQKTIERPNGYPLYHWVQTTSGEGEILIEGQTITLSEGQGILIPPHMPHSYKSIDSWHTCFATFNGTIQERIPKILGTDQWVLGENTTKFSYTQWIEQTLEKYESHQINSLTTSKDVYSFLQQLSLGNVRAEMKIA